jgi:hypothetical protein
MEDQLQKKEGVGLKDFDRPGGNGKSSKTKGQRSTEKKQGGVGFSDFFTVGPPHDGVDLGVTWSDLSFAPIKTGFFSRNSRENPCSKPVGGSHISRLVVVIIRKVSSISIIYL